MVENTSSVAEILGPEDEPVVGTAPREAQSYGLQVFNAAEIDQQVATAKQYPRSVAKFQRGLMSMATLDADIAAECMYSLPARKGGNGKPIEGPSARFAEMLMHSWGNCRGGARVIGVTDKDVVVQGAFHDLEANVAITREIRRRITNRDGQRFGDDMIAVTANAACSIAFRNCVLQGIPSAYWKPVFAKTRQVIAGKAQDLGARVQGLLKTIQEKYKVKPEQVYAVLEVKGPADIDVDKLITLTGIVTAIEEGDLTAEAAFGSRRKDSSPEPSQAAGSRVINDAESKLLETALYESAKNGGPTVAELCTKFGIERRELLPATKLNDALAWVKAGGGA